MGISTDQKKINELLSRGVDEVIDKGDLLAKLQSGKELRVKLGIDPTSPNIHLGRAVPLLKLRDFQELGHKVVFIIGDFTGVIGDTSDKESERPMLDDMTVEANAKDYITQAGKILDVGKCEVHKNSEWLNALTYKEVAKQADAFSVNNFIARDNISGRLKAGKRVSLREVLYPLMQGYDSVQVKADVEVGGTDQRFNLLAGRELQKLYSGEPQNIVMNPLIEGLDGRKMSSSWGNTINLTDTARDMFGKIMSLKDDFITKYFMLVTRVPMDEIASYEKELAGSINPKDIKVKLAKEIVKMYFSGKVADEEEEYFAKTFSEKKIPEDMPTVKPSDYDLLTVLIDAGFASSKGDAKRTIEQGGVKVNGEVVTDSNFTVPLGATVQKGKIHFVRLV